MNRPDKLSRKPKPKPKRSSRRPEFIFLSRLHRSAWLDKSPRLKSVNQRLKNHRFSTKLPVKRRLSSFTGLKGRLGYVVVSVWTLLFGFLSYDLMIGQWMAVLSGMVILILKLDSRYSFFSSLCLLILVPVFIVSNRPALADNYAVYSYFFLVFGTIAAVRELRTEDK